MYKVFINNNPLTFDIQKSKTHKNIPFINESDFDEAVDKLNHGNKGAHIFAENLEKTWERFQQHYKNIHAAGGIVFNDKNEILWIYRLDKWDLPKGKMEKGEDIETTAIREVEEECGISNLKIIKRLPDTFHMYYHKKNILKITHWFEMRYEGNQKLLPQTEEGITDAQWIPLEDLQKPLKNTYGNISELMEPYL